MSDIEQVSQELHETVVVLSDITGLASNWSGVVKLVEDADFKGQKPFQCDILLNASWVKTEVRWRTLLHEALHSFSQGYNREDFENFRGWEEGVVEKLQRLLRSTVLSRLAITVEETVFRAAEERHLYNGYLDALAELQHMSGQFEQQFYINLLGTPIRAAWHTDPGSANFPVCFVTTSHGKSPCRLLVNLLESQFSFERGNQMEFTVAEEQYRERLFGLILAAKTLTEIAATKQALQEWVLAHPDDLGIMDGFDHLAMSRSLAESREAVQQQAA